MSLHFPSHDNIYIPCGEVSIGYPLESYQSVSKYLDGINRGRSNTNIKILSLQLKTVH